jgi:general secretion pathway protein A
MFRVDRHRCRKADALPITTVSPQSYGSDRNSVLQETPNYPRALLCGTVWSRLTRPKRPLAQGLPIVGDSLVYKSFFGLKKNPFNVNPDPSYLYLTPQTGRTLEELTYGIETRKGLMLLTGEAGTGKTTLINHLLHWLEHQRARTAFIFNSHLDSEQLFDFIFSEFEIPVTPQAKSNPLLVFNDWLLARYRARDLVVLIVDEGQGLPIHVLEEIRLLSNMELPNEKLLQIILVGQPELEAKLRRPDLRQLQQRIGLRCKTSPLTLEEVAGYIESRLHTAGASSNSIFEPEAIEAVHSYSGGIPRVINLLCENALINAYAEHSNIIPAALVAEAARDLQFDVFRPVAPRLRTVDSAADVSDLHAILSKIKADADAWQEKYEKPKGTPYLVNAQKAVINHQGDAFSVGDTQPAADERTATVTVSRLPEGQYAMNRTRVWKRAAAGNSFSSNVASARARKAVASLRTSLEPAVRSIRKYDLEAKLRLYTHLVRIHGVEPTLRSIKKWQLEAKIRTSAKHFHAHGIKPAIRSLRKLGLDNRSKRDAKTVQTAAGPRLTGAGTELRSAVHAARDGATPAVGSVRIWWNRNFNEHVYGKTLVLAFLACSLLTLTVLNINPAQGSQHPVRIIIACLGILLCGLMLAAITPILTRARHKLRNDFSRSLAKTLHWLRAPIAPIPPRALSSVAGKMHPQQTRR